MAQESRGPERGDLVADPFFPAAVPGDYYDAPRPTRKRAPENPPTPLPAEPPPPVVEPEVVEPPPPVVEPRVADPDIVEPQVIEPQVVQPVAEPPPTADAPRDRDVIVYRRVAQDEHDAQPPVAAVSGFLPVLWAAAGAAFLVLGVVLGRWTSNSTNPASSPGTGIIPPAPSTDRPLAPAPGSVPWESQAVASEVSRLEAELKASTLRIDALRQRIDQLPAPAPAPDLTPVRSRVDDLAKAVEPLSGIPARLDALQASVEAAGKAADPLKTRLDALDRTLTRVQADLKAATEPSWNRAVELFKKGQYTAAREMFAALRETKPDDARLWYYSALANGFATAKWDGETERLMNVGVARERAGTPPADEIDAAFASLAPASGGNWLDAYRKRGTRP